MLKYIMYLWNILEGISQVTELRYDNDDLKLDVTWEQ